MSPQAVLIALAFVILPATFSSGEELLIAAAASLREPIEELAELFEDERESVEIRITFGASSSLARQIRLGAPVDVFVSADEKWILDLVARGLVARDAHFPLVGNRLVVIARPELGVRITKPGDLLDPSLERIALPSAAVPLGDYARRWLEGASLLAPLAPRLVTTEHAKASLVAVEQGHADAALIYASDAGYADRAEILFRIPAAEQPEIVYSAALLKRPGIPAAAADFLRMLAGDEAGRRLVSAGFVALPERGEKTQR